MLKDRKAICRNMLTNPFEKFERKRFLYYSKDLSVIFMNHALYSQMEESDWERVRNQLQEDMKDFFRKWVGFKRIITFGLFKMKRKGILIVAAIYGRIIVDSLVDFIEE